MGKFHVSFNKTICSVFSGADSIRMYALCGDSGPLSVTSSLMSSPACNCGEDASANVPASVASHARAHTALPFGPFALALKIAVLEFGISSRTSLNQ